MDIGDPADVGDSQCLTDCDTTCDMKQSMDDGYIFKPGEDDWVVIGKFFFDHCTRHKA